MAATFSGSSAPIVVDETASQSTGAVSTGIGLSGADGAQVATQRIGGAAFNLTVETDRNLATPA